MFVSKGPAMQGHWWPRSSWIPRETYAQRKMIAVSNHVYPVSNRVYQNLDIQMYPRDLQMLREQQLVEEGDCLHLLLKLQKSALIKYQQKKSLSTC